MKTELDKARQLIDDKDRQIECITNDRTERETALAQSLASEDAAVARCYWTPASVASCPAICHIDIGLFMIHLHSKTTLSICTQFLCCLES
jgi:hypothetical protein